jgi:hypothetical protein
MPPVTPPKLLGGSHLKNAFVLPGETSSPGGVDGTVQMLAVSPALLLPGVGSVVDDVTDGVFVRVRGPLRSVSLTVTFTRTFVLCVAGVPSLPSNVPRLTGREPDGVQLAAPEHAPTNVVLAGRVVLVNETFCASDGPSFATV